MPTSSSENPFLSQPSNQQGTRDEVLNRAGNQPYRRIITLDGAPGTYYKNIAELRGSTGLRIFGEIKQPISNDVTGVSLELWDGANSIPLTEAVTGVILSGLPVNAWIGKVGSASNALAVQDGAQVRLIENNLATILQQFLPTAKATGQTLLRMKYTTGNNPASGQIEFTVLWEKNGANGDVLSPP